MGQSWDLLTTLCNGDVFRSFLMPSISTEQVPLPPLFWTIAFRKPCWCWSPRLRLFRDSPFLIPWRRPWLHSLSLLDFLSRICYQPVARPKSLLSYCILHEVFLELAYPPPHRSKAIPIAEIEYDHGSHRILIEVLIEGAKSLLSSCIPNLSYDALVVYLQSFL